MDIAWIKTKLGKQVIGYLTDSQPAWFFSVNSKKLVFSNPAARLFNAKKTDKNLELAPIATPKAGQIEYLIELGSFGRSSLSRIIMQTKQQDIAITALVTPMQINNETFILIVGVNEIEQSIFTQNFMSDEINFDLFGLNREFIILDSLGKAIAGTKKTLDIFTKSGTSFLQNFDENVLTLPIGGTGNQLLIFEEVQDKKITKTPIKQEITSEAFSPSSNKEISPKRNNNLTSLLDRLAGDKELFTPLGKEDDEKLPIELDIKHQESELETTEQPALWKIIGEEFTPSSSVSQKQDSLSQDPLPQDPLPKETTPRTNEIEQVKKLDKHQDQSKYNFNELSRILTKKVGTEKTEQPFNLPKNLDTNLDKAKNKNQVNKTIGHGSLVNMPEEKLILNRLSQALLVFRDQQILFANRSMVDLLGYKNSSSLKNAALSNIFVQAKSNNEPVGPITHLMKFDKQEIAIDARLQSITWDGKTALMLSALKPNSEIQIDNKQEFISQIAKLQSAGTFKATRSGLLTEFSDKAADLFEREKIQLKNYPLSLLISGTEIKKLQSFLELDAQFAQSEPPAIMLKGNEDLEIMLFGEGNAGIINSYSGIVKKTNNVNEQQPDQHSSNDNSAMFSHVSRTIRRQLNTIIGFSELIRSEAFGAIDNQRYIEYSKDIKLAGYDILATIDELEDYAKLSDNNFTPQKNEILLFELLENCLARVRPLANQSKVLIRSSISKELPNIKADKKTLEQAILNLLASAIEQTQTGRLIIVSANVEADKSVIIHVRDQREENSNFNDNFVLFRDGVNLEGHVRTPKISSMGLAITKTMLEINSVSLEIEQNIGNGTLVSLFIPANMLIQSE